MGEAVKIMEIETALRRLAADRLGMQFILQAEAIKK